jgi:hypothetical protein
MGDVTLPEWHSGGEKNPLIFGGGIFTKAEETYHSQRQTHRLIMDSEIV